MAGAVNCSDFWTWPPNIFNPDCYGITFAKLFGSPAQQAAAYGATSPETVYAPVQQPPAVGSPTGPALTLPPADAQDAAQTIQRVIAREKAAWDAQTADTIAASAAGIDEIQQQATSPGVSTALTLVALGIGALIFGGFALGHRT